MHEPAGARQAGEMPGMNQHAAPAKPSKRGAPMPHKGTPTFYEDKSS
jgi:hypothetical protein